MFAVSQKPVFRRSFLNTIWQALTFRPAAELLASPSLHLLKTSLPINPDTVIADLLAAEADYSGYANQAFVVEPTLGNLGPDAVGGPTSTIFFVASPATVTNNIYGYWVDTGGSTDWIMAEVFDDPIPLVLPGDFLDLTVIPALATSIQVS